MIHIANSWPVWLYWLLAAGVSGYFNLDEVKNDIFDVGIAGDPVSLHTTEDGSTLIFTPQGDLVDSGSNMVLGNKNGQSYICFIPEPTVPPENESITSVFISNANITSRLEALQKLSCLKKTVGWWTYQLCPGTDIQQFRMDNGIVKGKVINLGHFDGNELWDKNISLTDGDKPIPFSHTQYYSNGTLCDVNNKLRKTEVKFICEENVSAYLHRVDEPSSCQYVFTVKTGFLCDIPGFKPLEARKPVSIECKPALTPAQMETYLDSLKDDDFFNLMEDREGNKIMSHRRSFMEMIFGPNEDKNLIDSMLDDDAFYDEFENDDNTDESVIRDERLREFYRKTSDPKDAARETEMVIKMQRLMDKLLKKRAEYLGLDPTNVQTFSMELNPGVTEQAVETKSTVATAQLPVKTKVPVSEDVKKTITQPHAATEKPSPKNLLKESKKAELNPRENDETDKEIYSEFDQGLAKIKPVLTQAEIEKIKVTMSQELDSIVDEAEKELRDDGYNDDVTNADGTDKAEALKTLSQTLTKLLKRIDDTERSIRITNEILDEATGKLAKISGKSPKSSRAQEVEFEERDEEKESDFEYSETQVKLPGGQLHVQQHSSKNGAEDSEYVEGTDEAKEDINDRIRVRVSKIKSDPNNRAVGSISDSLRRKINSQSQILEDQLAEKLKKAGFDPKGRHVQVKIITSGYFEDDGNGEVEILSEAETAQFSSLIVSLLAGDQEAKEQKRMETLEANYNFNPQKPRTKKSLYDDPEWQKITSYFHHEDEEEEEEEDENLPNFYI